MENKFGFVGMNMNNSKISIEEFLEIAHVKENTVRKNATKIPGLTYENGVFDILKGTRYPGDFHRYKMKNSAERRYVLLKAISEYKYIDHLKLRVYREQFVALLQELLDAELIVENHLYNSYGANAYDCSIKGDKLIERKQKEAIEEISFLVSSSAGHFTGAVISEIFS